MNLFEILKSNLDNSFVEMCCKTDSLDKFTIHAKATGIMMIVYDCRLCKLITKEELNELNNIYIDIQNK